jgi:predicted metal-dependent hydrolase
VNIIRKYFRLLSTAETKPGPDYVEIASQQMPVVYRRHSRAKNYVLRLHTNRTVVVTLPRRGSLNFARQFVASRKGWLEKQWRLLETRKVPPQVLRAGMEVLFRGRSVTLHLEQHGPGWELRLENEHFPIPEPEGDLRPDLEYHLRKLAQTELAVRVGQLAHLYQSTVRRVVVRNQKSRWGSCSHNSTISLNWRLIQIPAQVRDYIIVHELMHLRHLNHSKQFWGEVERVCPDYLEAEAWLKQNSGRVGF